ncbi:hypothetical protein ACFKHW_17295 [Bradyrhizobium lupini]|uniref:hypothetical protein n=1 Tax=Rhizobium lupini TaxID=136996 RepID=UPI00366B7309
MNVQAETPSGRPVADAIWLLETRALIRAFLEYEYQFEHLADAIDPLQEFAEQSGLVAAIGQDEVQRLIAAPFERFRATVAAEIEAEQEALHLPSDYAAQLIKQWELDDSRDRHRWTGEMPPVPQAERRQDRVYKPADSTVDAFAYVLGLGDSEYLARWLTSHPTDAPHLLRLYEEKYAA